MRFTPGSIAVVGVGAMGGAIVRRLLATGHDVVVWNRSADRLAPLLESGAVAAATPRDAAAEASVLITMVSDPTALRAVTEGPAGVAAGAGAHLTVIEMSTVGPAAIARLSSILGPDVGLVDGPVLGSVDEAAAGTLTVLAGGAPAPLAQVRPVLEALGSVIPVGACGAGAAAKLVANASLFSTIAALGEVVALARGLGLSRDAVSAVLAATPLANQAERRLPLIEVGAYPRRFGLALARKDADLILDAAETARVEARVIAAARSWLGDAETAGLGAHDYTAVLATIVGAPLNGMRPASDAPGELGRYDGLIIDLDGTVWLGGQPIGGAVAALERLRADGTRVVFVTNDPQLPRSEQAARLTAIGIPATVADVLTASAATASHLGSLDRLAGGRALVIGSLTLQSEIEAAGFELVATDEAATADVVVVGGHDRFDYGELRAATAAVAGGAELFATSRDPAVPAQDGPRPGTGAILAAVETATGVRATVVGKPAPAMFEAARELLAGCERVAVVGDSLVSDIAGAKRAGLDAILVLTGATTKPELRDAVVWPDAVVPSLAAVSQAA